jgi:Holliday junction resolvasome RuvABC endonuclease subunit
VEDTRRVGNIFAARRYSELAHRLYALVAEVTELTEKVDNALQVTEDVFLARIYTAALELFRVRTVSAAVDRKLAIIRDTYAALYNEASGVRSEVLEVAIIVLIVIEVGLAVLRH